jgi:hypothetical protein
MNFYNNLTKAREQAKANADTFNVCYFIVATSMGVEVTRERPVDESRIIEICIPPDLT